MIVCSCSVLSRARIVETAEALAARPQCGTCFATIRTIVAQTGLAFTCPEPLASEAEKGDARRDVAVVAGV
jgi:bacterioferritin-associated ferredoxin